MANRFVQGIRAGRIDSLEELKAAFKELAKATHPDLAGADSGQDFVAVRSEYESALADFELHRFGVARSRIGDPGGDPGARVPPGETWACLALFLKRGFPKEPRHEKEILRYEYARWRLRGALRGFGGAGGAGGAGEGPDATARFDAFEAEVLALRKAVPDSVGECLALLRGLVDYAERDVAAMRTALVRDLGDLRLAPGLGPATHDFLALLAGELGIGPTLG